MTEIKPVTPKVSKFASPSRLQTLNAQQAHRTPVPMMRKDMQKVDSVSSFVLNRPPVDMGKDAAVERMATLQSQHQETRSRMRGRHASASFDTQVGKRIRESILREQGAA